MLQIPFDLNEELVKKGNEYLESLFFDSIELHEIKHAVRSCFPEHLALAEYNKCKQIYLELYTWTRDKFIHKDLSSLHQYCLYQLLRHDLSVQNDMGEGELVFSDDDELDLEIAKNNIDKAEFYLEFFFYDHDFLDYDLFYGLYGSVFFFQSNFSSDIVELLPRDLREDILRDQKEQSNKMLRGQYHDELDFLAAIDKLLIFIRRKIEENQAYKLLWDNEKNRIEKYAQILLRTVADSFCEYHNLVLSSEVDTGRGCVDFKISHGKYKALLEVKNKTSNVKKGIKSQLKTYLKAEKINYGYLLAFIYTDAESKRIKDIQNEEIELDKAYILRIEPIDVRLNKRSASVC